MSGTSFGCAFTDRVSELSLRNARSIAWHTHDETEIVCCIKGALTYEFRRRLSVTLPSGCFLVIPQGLGHRLVNGIDGPCRRISIYLREQPDKVCGSSAFTTGEYRELLALLLKKRLCAQNFSAATANNLNRIANLAIQGELSPLDKVKMRTFITSSLVDFATEVTAGKPKPQVRLIGEAVKWLEEHYAEKVTLSQLTTFMGYGKTRFSELFKQRTGLAPLEWLTRFRIDKACDLLETDTGTIAEIAHGVGFDDPAFFARTFRKRTGTSPRDYQKKALKRMP